MLDIFVGRWLSTHDPCKTRRTHPCQTRSNHPSARAGPARGRGSCHCSTAGRPAWCDPHCSRGTRSVACRHCCTPRCSSTSPHRRPPCSAQRRRSAARRRRSRPPRHPPLPQRRPLRRQSCSCCGSRGVVLSCCESSVPAKSSFCFFEKRANKSMSGVYLIYLLLSGRFLYYYRVVSATVG